MLTRSHFTQDMERDIPNEWVYVAFFRTLLIQRGFLSFLINDFEFTIHKDITDDTGNFIAIEI